MIATKLLDAALAAKTESATFNTLIGKDANGLPVNITAANAAQIIGGLLIGKSAADNIFIMYHRKSDNYPLMVKPEYWTSIQNSGEIADGVVVVSGDKLLVVAPTEASKKWSSAAVSGGGYTTTDRQSAYQDFAGRANTTSQLTHAECQGTDYAAGYCNSYSRSNGNNGGLGAGKWFCPAEGQMMLVYAYMNEINYALSLITGSTQLARDWYWSSTEYSSEYAWYLYLNDGYMNGNAKATGTLRVRPVSAFIS